MSENHSVAIRYSRSRFPYHANRDGKCVCRGCGGDIPKGRRTWCSRACCKKYHPAHVMHAVRERDKGVCTICGLSIDELRERWKALRPDYPKLGHLLTSDNHAEYDAYRTAFRAWSKRQPIEEYDHIIPFSEGGLTVLDNIRTLCRDCHRKRTTEWRKSKAKKKPSQPSPPDLF